MGIFGPRRAKIDLPITIEPPGAAAGPALLVTLDRADGTHVGRDGRHVKVEGFDVYAPPEGWLPPNDPWGLGLRSVGEDELIGGEATAFFGRVTGVAYHRAEASVACLLLGRPVWIQLDTAQSATALRVACATHLGAHKAGYLPFELAKELLAAVSGDADGRGIVVAVHRDNHGVSGLRILGTVRRTLTVSAAP